MKSPRPSRPSSVTTRLRLRPAALAAAIVLGPLTLGVSVVVLGAIGLRPAIATCGATALAVWLGAIAAATKRGPRLGLASLAPLLILAPFLSTMRASPLPTPAALETALPRATPPAGMAVHRLPTGLTHRTAAFAYRGGSPLDRRDFAMTAVLVRHPRGDLLIDAGLGRDLDAQIGYMPLWFRATTRYERRRSVAEQLDAAGYDRRALRAVVLTHAHWDHVSGVPELAGTPVWVTPEERRHIDDGGAIMGLTRSFGGVRYEEYTFEGGPYLGFPRSHDVYGDGAIVIVPAPGHTPGSVIVFLTLPTRQRYALVGDLVWQLEGVSQREERPWLQRTLADDDPAAVRDGIARVAAIAARYPEIAIVPAHDARAFAALPQL